MSRMYSDLWRNRGNPIRVAFLAICIMPTPAYFLLGFDTFDFYHWIFVLLFVDRWIISVSSSDIIIHRVLPSSAFDLG